MWSYIIIGVVVLLFLVYRILTWRPRAAVRNVATRLNVKPHLVGNMLKAMGVERGNMFIEHMTVWRNESITDGAYTFIVYQIMCNSHPENIKWWKGKLDENDINPNMTIENVEAAFVYLRHAGADVNQSSNFLDLYNENK